MGILKRLLGRDRYVLFSVASGRYFNGSGWTVYKSGARKYSKGNIEALQRSFLYNYIIVTILEV